MNLLEVLPISEKQFKDQMKPNKYSEMKYDHQGTGTDGKAWRETRNQIEKPGKES